MPTTTYTILGDSIPKGIIYKDNKIQVSKQDAVTLIENYYDIEINNLSVYGQTVKRLYNKNTIDSVINNLKQTDNNVVILSIGGNDADYNWCEVAKQPTKNTKPVTPIKQFKKMLQEMINKLQSNDIKVIITTMLPLDCNKYFNNVISKKADKKNVLKFLKQDLNNITRQHERYNMALIELAILNNCPILDIRSEFLLNRNYSKYLCKDGIHPNENGYKLLAKNVIKLTKNFFKSEKKYI